MCAEDFHPISENSIGDTSDGDPFDFLRRRFAEEAEAFRANPQLEEHLAGVCVRSLARNPTRELIIDHASGRRVMRAGLLLAVAVSLAARWRRRLPGRRIGVVLPPGIGGTVVNLALVILDKTPVNLNFTIGRAAAQSCIRQSGLKTVITARKLRDKYPDFPWPDDTRDAVDEIAACGKPWIMGRLLFIRLLPVSWLPGWFRVPRKGGDRDAAVLFTSGSSGDPKGVVLTHRNIMANAEQISKTGILPAGCSLMACLPIFHSFGFTVTMWYPMIAGLTIVSYPSPLETRKLAEIIHREGVDVLVGSATFLRPFLKRARPEQLAGLRFAVAGAERLPIELYHAFIERFGVAIVQGYGLTETAPVVSINYAGEATGITKEREKLGSVGMLVHGLEARIVSIEGDRDLSLGDTGILWLRGPNVFGGYLDNETKTLEAIQNGWFITGDVARFDVDGFLYLEGRLSRFSKIGGEMVPHGVVEERITRLFGWDESEEQICVVLGIPDDTKGERLVLLTSRKVDPSELRSRLLEAGFPNLWIPKVIREVDSIPTLATGKCDLRRCQLLVTG
jgi:acyl-[acyl-carrier-protein]-phospholipid O-acyltransferase/long-chain-fatty-acid--[acyl-carrier-protein] ligase